MVAVAVAARIVGDGGGGGVGDVGGGGGSGGRCCSYSFGGRKRLKCCCAAGDGLKRASLRETLFDLVCGNVGGGRVLLELRQASRLVLMVEMVLGAS